MGYAMAALLCAASATVATASDAPLPPYLRSNLEREFADASFDEVQAERSDFNVAVVLIVHRGLGGTLVQELLELLQGVRNTYQSLELP